MAKLIPAILTRNTDEISEKLKFLDQFDEIEEVQIDFADGRFVESQTAMPFEIRTMRYGYEIEAHMMVENPSQYFHNLEQIGTQTVVLHFESFDNDERIRTALQNLSKMNMRPGLAINPNTPVETFSRFIDYLEVCLILGVYPGYQGQEFIPESYDRIKLLRELHQNAIIEIDGGVKLDNFQQIVAAGADRVVVGSGIWLTVDPAETIRLFLEKIKK